MKKTLFATAFTVAALACAPAFAQATGYVGVSAGYGEAEFGGFEADGEAFGVEGAVAAPISERLSVQVGASYSDAESTDGVFAGSAHLIGELDGGRIGGFVGMADVMDETLVMGGVEGQAHLEQVTLAGTLTYGTVDDLDLDLWGVGAEARFFASDNFRIDGSLGWVSLDAGGGEADAWTAGVGGEYQFAGPVSVFGGYTHVEINDFDASADVFSVGVRFNFGGGALRDRDRAGASFGGAQALASIAAF